MVVEVEGVVMELPQNQNKWFDGKVHFQQHDQRDYWCFYNPDQLCDGDDGKMYPCFDTKPGMTVPLKSMGGGRTPPIAAGNTRCLFIGFGS